MSNPELPTHLDDPDIRAHLERQHDVPEGFVKMSDGTTRPLGGNADNGEDQ